jgi:RNA polymerase sigma factor (sigma-70 family)
MNERHQDCELLRAFARQGDQPAFAAVVRRHLDLVYATALRKLEDPGAAEEVAQNVFAALARKAWQFGPDDSLPAWLHRTALLEAKMWLRGELRRRRREQAAAEMGTTMKTPDEQSALRALVPLLDEALLSLREKERTALLLRYYESQSLRDVGATLGVSEDAARKRVGAALDSLSSFFQRHGFKTATTAAAAAALQHTATAAPATLAAAIAQTAMQAVPAGFATLAVLLSRLASLTKTQVAALCLVLAVAPVSWQWLQTQRAPEAPRPRSASPRPGGALSQAIPAPARDNEPASEEDASRARLFGLLTAADYHWPEDLDFVRIPKSAVKAFNPARTIDRLDQIRDWGAELLGLTPEEQQQTEEVLRAHTQAFGELAASQAYETNYLMDALTEWASPPHKSVWVPPLGADLQTLMADLREQLRQVLGDERTQLLLGEAAEDQPCFSHSFWTWGDLFKGKGVLLTIVVNPDHPSGVEYSELVNGGGGGFYYHSPDEVRSNLPEAITIRCFGSWLAQMGITNAASRARLTPAVTSATYTPTLAGTSMGITNIASAAKPTPQAASAMDTSTLTRNLILRAPPPSIQSFSASGATLTIRGTNGISNWQYVVLASTNLSLPLAQWTPMVTNAVGVNGDFDASIAFTNTLAPNAAQQFFILSFSAPPAMAAPRFNAAAAVSATGLRAQVGANRPGLNKPAAASVRSPGTARAWAARSSLATQRPMPAELRQRLGIRWDNSPDYILVSKGALNHSGRGPFESEHSGPLIPATCAVLGLTPAERAASETAFLRAEAEHAAWVKTVVQRAEPAGDILADYWIPANPELARQIEAETKALLSVTLGPDRADLVQRWSNAWWFRHGGLGRDNFRFTVRRHTDGGSQPLWYALVVPEHEVASTMDGDVTPTTPFPELLRSVFPGGWRDLAQREHFALPKQLDDKTNDR